MRTGVYQNLSDRIKIKKQNLAIRCEICHKTDLFDPILGECGRCSNLEKRNISELSGVDEPELQKTSTTNKQYYSQRIIASGAAIGFLLGYMIFFGLFIVVTEQNSVRIILSYAPEFIPLYTALIGALLGYMISESLLRKNISIENKLLIQKIFNLVSIDFFCAMVIGFLNDNSPRYKNPIPFSIGCIIGLFIGIAFNAFFAQKFFVKKAD